jgi:RNA-directed DNA polymerase
VNWVLDADIRDFFTSLDHCWLEKFLEHRIADKRILRLLRKWLKAGVIENGTWSQTLEGAPQGASASPLLANVYLHYVLDLWAKWWRSRHTHGDMIIVRFADDFIVGFEYQDDAQRFLTDLRERFAKFGLELHGQKTRLIEFGRHATRRRKARGLGKPGTFDFLGFTHLCGKTRDGRFGLRRITISSGCGRNRGSSNNSFSGNGISLFPSRANGWQAWCEGTSHTTPCPATARRSGHSAPRQPGTGTGRYGAAASAPA